MNKNLDVKVLVLEGNAQEIGQAHGQKLKSVIQNGVDRWKKDLHKLTGIEPKNYIDQFIEDTNMIAAAKKWTANLLEEIEGISQGAEIDFNTVFAWQCVDEEWWYRVFEKKLGFEALGLKKCSGLGCFKEKGSPPLLAQNLELPNYYDGLQTLLHIKHSKSRLESLVFTPAGVIGMNGLNNQPLGVCVNTLLELINSKDGLPVAFVVRGILEQPTLDNAVRFLREVRHASGQNYILGDAEKIVDFECSANKVSQYLPRKGTFRICHTNHVLANDDRRPLADEVVKKSTTRARFDSVKSQLNDPLRKITVDIIKSILSSHEAPVCVHKTQDPGTLCTFGSMIMSLSKSPILHLASGPPCSTEWRRYKF